MGKKFKKIFTVFLLFAVLAASAADTAFVLAADRDTAMANDPDPFIPKQAQPYNTNNLKLTKGLTYTKNGKEIEVTNAIDTMVFCADPTSIEVDGKIYMYATLDQRSYAKNFNANGDAEFPSTNPSNGMVIGNKYQTKKLAIYSTADLVNWTDEGVIDMDKVPSTGGGTAGSRWAWNSWAPSALKYDSDGDGKDEYYIFFTNGGDVGYVKGETPTGPWKDELGRLLIEKSKIPNGMGNNIIWNFDPSVLMDDDGNAYIYWGGGNPPDPEGSKHPKTSRACRLKILPDKVEMDWSTLTQLDAYYMFEDNEINKFQGKYVYSYCANWNVPRDNKYIKDGAAVSIIAYISDDPLHVTSDPENYKNGQPKYLGAILRNPGAELFNEWYNNHHHMFEFKGKYYILYHTTALDQFLYKDFYAAANKLSLSYRNMHIDEIKVDVAGQTPSIQIQPTYEGPTQVQNFNPYQVINATTQSHQGGLTRTVLSNGTVVLDKIDTGDWTRIDQVDFGANGAGSLKASISSTTAKGSIEVYLDEALTGTKIATLPLKQTGSGSFETVSATLSQATGVHDVYFVFRGSGYQVASWEFVPGSADAVTVPKPAIKALNALNGNRVRVTLKKAIKKADGYEIRYSTTSDMADAKTVTVAGSSKLKTTISNLDNKKTYYIQVRAYKSVNGKPYYYSSWSGKKKIKVTK